MSPVVVTRPARVFHGGWVTLAFVSIVFLTSGVRFTVGPFLKPIVSDLELARGRFSLVISLSLLLYGAIVPLGGGAVGAGRQSALLISAAELRPVAGGG